MGSVGEEEEGAGGEGEATGSSAEVDLNYPPGNRASARHWAKLMAIYINVRLVLHHCLFGEAAWHAALSFGRRSSILSKANFTRVRIINGREQ